MNFVAIDQWLREWVVGHRIHQLDGVMLGLTAIGGAGLVWPVIAIVLAFLRHTTWRVVVRVVLAVVVTTIAADYVVKPLVHRPRPFLAVPDVPVIGHRPHDTSLPSGHAADAVAGAVVLSRAVPSGWMAWWALATAIAYSRVYLGVHYPSDIAASVIVGFCCASLVFMVERRTYLRAAHDSGKDMG